MKTCSYCGAEYPDDVAICPIDHTPLEATVVPAPEPPPAEGEDARVTEPTEAFVADPEAPPAEAEAEEPPVPPPKTDLSALDMGFEIVQGFSRPDWGAIARFVKEHVPEDDLSAAWDWIAAQWLEAVAQDLGGKARFRRTANFFCVSDLDGSTTKTVLAYTESALKRIRSSLGEAAWSGFHGKHVLLLFADHDRYLEYISYFFREGEHPASWGVFLRWGYAHIALAGASTWFGEQVIVHELVHNLLCHLPLPRWLNEGLATSLECRIARQLFDLNADLIDRHRAHWNATNIQSFWAGTSFGVPGDDCELSYSLGQILATLLSEKGPSFISFVKHAEWKDGGQAAAERFLGQDLGEAAAGFLGPGNWSPNREAIAQLWEDYGKKDQE